MKPTTFVLDEVVANSENLTANHNRPRTAATSLHEECFATEFVPVSTTNVSSSNGSSEALGLRRASSEGPDVSLGLCMADGAAQSLEQTAISQSS
ncbi:hypothetical protein V6N13_016914 [Hibiscus sabdariffa]